jgi:hypothetical protein
MVGERHVHKKYEIGVTNMSQLALDREVQDLQEVCKTFQLEFCPKASQLGSQLLSHLLSRIAMAIDEGLPSIEAECRRRILNAQLIEGRSGYDTLIRALEDDLVRNKNPTLQWILISYWVALCDFGGIQLNIEALLETKLEDWIWVVGGALWVQSASGQPTAHELREALMQIRARYPAFDAHLAAALAGPPSHIRDAAEIADRLFTDPAAMLPTFKVF